VNRKKTSQPDHPNLLRIVLTDACVLYSRVLRDYLLYSAEYQIVSVAWSSAIMDEMTEHLVKNLATFTEESAERLVAAMTRTFPYALRNPNPDDYRRIQDISLPDEHDRHVYAAALASQADIVCTSNLVDFPASLADTLGFEVMSPDDVLCQLIALSPETMLLVHQTSVANLKGATDESTMAALRRAGAPRTAQAMSRLLQGLVSNHEGDGWDTI